MDASSAETQTRLAAANRKYAKEMRVLSPHGRLKGMTTPVFLLHGEADNIIPSAEALWMASELPGTSLRAMLISPVLSHLDMDRAPGSIDQWRLLHFFAEVMRAAERERA
jgi:pimeloyl-ACP methyl ester carboxylesterase